MNCRKVKRELISFIDGSLDETARAAVAEHLWLCPRCAREERRLRSVKEMLGQVRLKGPSPPLLRATRRRIAAEQATPAREFLSWRPSLSFTLSAILMVFLIISGVLVAYTSTSGQRAKELYQIQQAIQNQGLIRQVSALEGQMPQLSDQILLAGMELTLREVVNLDPKTATREDIGQIQDRLRRSQIATSLPSLLQRAEGKQVRRFLASLLPILQKINNL